MARQAKAHEKVIFDVIKGFQNGFYYQSILKEIENDEFSIKIEKRKEEMVGFASISFDRGDKVKYEVRYNRIVNLNDGYTILVS